MSIKQEPIRAVKYLCHLLVLTLMLLLSLVSIGLFNETNLSMHALLASALIFLVLSIKNLWSMRKQGVYYLIVFILASFKLSQTNNIIVEIFEPFIIFTGLIFAFVGLFNLEAML